MSMKIEISTLLNPERGTGFAQRAVEEAEYYKDLSISPQDKLSITTNIPRMVETIEEEPQVSNLSQLLGDDIHIEFASTLKPGDMELTLFSLSTAPSLTQTSADLVKAQAIGNQKVEEYKSLTNQFSTKIVDLSSKVATSALNRIQSIGEKVKRVLGFGQHTSRLSLERGKSYRFFQNNTLMFIQFKHGSSIQEHIVTSSNLLSGPDLQAYQANVAAKINEQTTKIVNLLKLGIENITEDQMHTRKQMGKFVRE
ncbi:MAG: hypothetical protein JHC93_03445 [Parachlamydiales bacterium]|nr:hypothetical protein [Parachlamydiales bacterium]